jgi:hypothetical protein
MGKRFFKHLSIILLFPLMSCNQGPASESLKVKKSDGLIFHTLSTRGCCDVTADFSVGYDTPVDIVVPRYSSYGELVRSVHDFVGNIGSLTVPEVVAGIYLEDSSVRNLIIQDGSHPKYVQAKENEKLESIHFSSTMTAISPEAFSGCKNLKRVEFPENLRWIGYRAFISCTSLASIETNAGVIGERAFMGCENLSEVLLKNGVTEIHDEAFYDSSCQSVFIPKTVEKIGKQAFSGNAGVMIYCEADEKPDGWDDTWCNGSSSVRWGVTETEYRNGKGEK